MAKWFIFFAGNNDQMAMRTKQMQFRESLTKRIQERMAILEQVRNQLKQEFFGIDGVIDEVVEAISSWYLFPEIQEKPVIVNLWGMTGVGKSSLIRRLSGLIGFSKKLFWFDLGETSDRDWVIRRTLNELFENENGYPVILCFDEFQHGRTKNAMGEEISKPDLRIIWNLLSEGSFQMPRYFMRTDSLYFLIHELRNAVEQGVLVEEGILVSGAEAFSEIMAHRDELAESLAKLSAQIRSCPPQKRKEIYRKAAIPFIPGEATESLFELVSERFSTRAELKQHLRTLDGPGSIRFLQHQLETAISFRTVDCTKAIMFVVGNLDDAYTMSMNLNPDMDADAFHRSSLRITVPHIKKSLRKLFRPEQIARLGNTHILYPTLNKEAFRKIISNALDSLRLKVRKQAGLTIEFDQTIHQLIYDEGVYPTQGARPLFTTIHILLESKLGKIISEALIQSKCVTEIRVTYHNALLKIRYMGARETLILEITEPVRLILEFLRKPKMDDMQAIVAVHESGHAILFSLLLHTIPEMIVSVSADPENHGFTNVHFTKEYRTKAEIIPMLATRLGGFIAEKLVFGEDHVTLGSESDIREATELACEMIKASGMGSIRGSIQVASTNTNDQLHQDMDAEIKELLEGGEKLAEETLREEWVLLLQMADYLSDHRLMDKVMIEGLIRKYSVTKNPDEIRNTSQLSYRSQLKKCANLVKKQNQVAGLKGWENILLNKTNA